MKSLTDAILRLETPASVSAFLAVMFTPKELESLQNRWHACQLALCGASHRAIRDELHISNTTIARCSRALQVAPKDFFNLIEGISNGPATPIHSKD